MNVEFIIDDHDGPDCQTLQERLAEILDCGENEALLSIWVDDDGDICFGLNETEPHFSVTGNAIASPYYPTTQ